MKNSNWLAGTLVLALVAAYSAPSRAEDEPADDAAASAAEDCPNCALIEEMRPRDPTAADYILAGVQAMAEAERARVEAMSPEERRAYEENLAAYRRYWDWVVETGGSLFARPEAVSDRSSEATPPTPSISGRLPADHDCTGHGRSGRGR